MIPLPPWALKLILGGLGALALMAVGAAAWDRMPLIGPHAVIGRLTKDRDAWKTSAADWKRAAGGWEASFRSSEAIRAGETNTARAAVNADAAACDDRVREARRSTSAIQALTRKEPTIDPTTHCPVRSLMPSIGLRDALRPTAGPY